ncbi:Protein clt2, chloroplastic [Stylosanthes scabra]|uniref:Protein clt2, chloroplastic n=1 Tax=Stylosanthes scabra TaxID=79078 RepID=A0ABU6S3E7_9FABA|nr:Protein clt2, chloroplastic [Stylosanthes scabra]
MSSNSQPLHFSHTNRTRTTTANNNRLKIRASSSSDDPSPSTSSGGSNLILFSSAAITVTLAVANRVLYKLALVPMKDYPFFLAQFTTFGYVVVYFSMLYIRYRAGIVSDEMLAIPKLRFVAIGFLEALGVATGMFAAAVLPGPVIPVLSQTFLVWQLMISILLLGRRYSINQLVGCFLVATGVVVTITSGSNTGQVLSEVEFFWPALMIVSSAFQAAASVIKESVFIDSAIRLKQKSLDIFVVNSFGSGFQALFVLLFLPFLSNLKGIPFLQLPSYLKSGAGCFLNLGAHKSSCDGAPWLPLLYIVTNLTFNISLLNVVKTSSAVVASLMVMLSVPISVIILSLPLPYLPEGTSLSPVFVLGCAILVSGLYLYNSTKAKK